MTRAATVAIIDDDLSVRRALGRLLAAASFEPATYGSAREFMESLRESAPACIIVDMHMPELSGLDLQHYLSREKHTIPTIVITAYDDAEIRAQCFVAGARAYFIKPLDGAELVRAVHAATDRGRERALSEC